SLEEGAACFEMKDADDKVIRPMHDYCAALASLLKMLEAQGAEGEAAALAQEATAGLAALRGEIAGFEYLLAGEWAGWSAPQTSAAANALVAEQAEVAEQSREL